MERDTYTFRIPSLSDPIFDRAMERDTYTFRIPSLSDL